MTPRERIDRAYEAYRNLMVIRAMGSDRFVPGAGPLDSPLMFVGEAPGEQEDRELTPFVGRSGQLLRRLMEQAGISPGDCYITNVVKVRPPLNRTPYIFELQASRPCLHAEVLAIRPALVVTLGIPAVSGGFGFEPRTIRDHHGERLQVTLDDPEGDGFYGFTTQLMPLYHPSYILREGKEDMMLADLEKI